MVPEPFRAPRILRLLNVAGVGLSLASVASASTGYLLGRSFWVALSTAAPTWVLGTLWAALLRSPRTFRKTSIRVGWVASVPLAMANAAIGAALAFSEHGLSGHLTSFPAALLAATFGAIYWIPALLLTLLTFGLPIARAQRLAREGLAGEDRGEVIVGLACVVLGGVGCVLGLPPFEDARRMGLTGPVICQTTGALGRSSAPRPPPSGSSASDAGGASSSTLRRAVCLGSAST